MPFLDGVPVLDSLFNNWSVTEWFVIVLVFLMMFLFYKTVWGLGLRAVGQFPMAAETAGINVNAMKYQAIAISGLIGGLAGAHLSLGYSQLFTEGMTNSRGFMGVAAMYFGGAHPSSYSGWLSDIRIYRFIGSPYTGVWCSIPVCIADALRGDHYRTGSFHDI